MTATSPEKKTGQLTAYKVLKRTRTESKPMPGLKDDDDAVDVTSFGTNETWEVVASLSARSADAAIKAHVEKTNEDGTYAAVSARSFAPVSVKVETTRTVRLGEAA